MTTHLNTDEGARMGATKTTFPLKTSLAGLALLFLISAGPLWAQVTHYSITTTAGYGLNGGSFNVGQSVTFQVQALNIGNALVGGYNNSVTIGFYDTSTGVTQTDPFALIGPGAIGNAPQTGTAVLNFSSGTLNMWATFQSGYTSEQLFIQDGAVPVSVIYPKGAWGGAIPAFNVTGYPQLYYLQDANMNGSPASYLPATTNYDNLITDDGPLTVGSEVGVTVNYSSSGVSLANTYAVTGVNGGYTNGSGPNANVFPSLWFENTGVAVEAVSVWVILDYNGTLTDFNSPVTTAGPNEDTLYAGGFANVNPGGYISGDNLTSLSFKAGRPPGAQQFMTNGQIIVRVWAPNNASTILMRYQSPSGPASLSYISVPYSPNNIQPVNETLSPTQYLAGSATSVTCIFKNQTGTSVSTIIYKLPANAGGNWNFPGGTFPTTVTGYSGSTVGYSNPSGSTAGSVTLTFSGGLLANSQSATVIMPGTVSSIGGGMAWDFGQTAVTSFSGTSLPANNAAATVFTLSSPDTPGSFAAAPVSFAPPGTGGAVSLSWSPSVSQSPEGYVITRNPGTGAFANPVTLPSGAIVSNAITVVPAGTTNYIDSTAPNLSGSSYTIKSFNFVAESGTAAVGPVTAFANPGPPTVLAALTGGTTIQLQWSAPASVSGSYAVTGYQVFRSTSPGGEGTTPIATVYSSSGSVSFTDTGLTTGPSSNYYYVLSTIDTQYPSGPLGPPGAAHNSSQSTEVSGNPPGNPPSGAAATLVNSSPATIQLTWTGPSNFLNSPLAGYEVSRAITTGGFAPLTFVASPSSPATINDTAVTAGSYYIYEVQAVDNLGVTSNPSNAVTGRVGPPPPQTPTPVPSGTGVTLIWPAVANSNGETVVNYLVYRSSTAIAAPVTTAAASLTYTDTTAAVGTDYFYQIAAVDQVPVTGALSGGVSSARLPTVPAALGVSLDLTNDNVAVTWATPSPVEPNLQQYSLTQAINTATPTVVATPAGSSVSYLDASITSANAGQTVTYSLTAQNDLGGVGPPASVSLQIPPNAPTGLSFTASSTAVTLNWTARPASEGVTQYTVYRVNSVPATVVAGTTTGAVAFTDNSGSLAQGNNYIYFITAGNGGGPGLGSTPVTAALLPLAPASLTAAVSATSTQFDVAVTWTAPASSGNLTGYNLYRNTTATLAGATLLLSGAATTTTNYADALVLGSAGTTIYYFVQGQNAGGSGATNMVGFQVPPNPPIGVAANSSSAAITVSWTAIAGQNVSQYNIYRAALPAGTPTVVGTATPGTANSFNDVTGLSQGISYVYYLTATDPGGGVGVPGGPSLPSASVTWGLAPPVPTGLNVSSINTNNDISVAWTGVLAADPNATGVSLLSNTVNNSGSATPINLAAGTVSNTYLAQTPDTTYYYWLETINPYGDSVLAGPVSQLTYPAPVNLISVLLDSDGVSRDITWTTVGGADVISYTIYRELSTASSFVSVGSASATGLTFPVKRTNPVLPGSIYYYKITAVNATGEGTSANIVTIGMPPSDPAPVTALSGINTGVQVNLSWAANVPSENVASYKVYRGTTATFASAVLLAGGIGTTNYSDSSGLTGTTVYYYWVEATGGNGSDSVATATTSSVTVTAYALPNLPVAPTATSATGSVTLNWSAPAVTTYPVSIYSITRVSGGVTTTSTSNTPTLTDTGLTNGTSYIYTIQTIDTQGHLSAASAPVTGLPIQPPAAPTNVTPSAGNEAIQITWTAATKGTYLIGGYEIFRATSPGGPYSLLIQLGPSATGFVDGNPPLTNSPYYYYVVTLDNSGVTTGLDVSSNSTTVNTTPVVAAVNPPNFVTAQGGVAQIALSWTDAFTGTGAPVTGYQIWRDQNGGSYTLLTTIAAGTSPYTDSTAANGNTYGYYFVSYAGSVASANSVTVFATAANAPTVPAGLTAVDGNGFVTLNWTANAAVNNVPVTQYILTSTAPGFPVTVNSATTTVSATLANGTSYTYQIEAMNENGTLSGLSGVVTGYPFTPFPPTGLTATDSATAVTLNWAAPVAPDWPPIPQYTIIRTTLAGGSPVTFTTASASYTDSTPGTLGQLYIYTLTATDSHGNSTPAGAPVTDGPVGPMAAPATLLATAGSQQVIVDWPAPVSVAGSLPVSFYLLTINDPGGAVTIQLPASQTWYLDSGLVDPAGVTVSVVAVDTTGFLTGNHISAVEGPVTVATSSSDLNPPTGLAVTATSPTKNLLTWTLPNDEGYIVTDYKIYRSNSFITSLGSPIATIANPALAPVTFFNDGGVTPNNTYYYVVAADYIQGPSTVLSPPSNNATDTTPALGAGVPPVKIGQMAFDANLLKPMTGQTLNIFFITPNSGPVEIDVYNVSGNPVRALYAAPTAGVQDFVTWDGKDRNGRTVASGIYLIEIKAVGMHQVKKVLVVK